MYKDRNLIYILTILEAIEKIFIYTNYKHLKYLENKINGIK